MSEPSSTAAGRARKPHQHVHLMADYGSAGVWDHDGAPLDPVKLPLSPRLRARLTRWCARFQESFETEIDLDAFASEGRAIARAMKKELPDWSIVYFDDAAAAARGIADWHRAMKRRFGDRPAPRPPRPG